MATESSHWHIMGKTLSPRFIVTFNRMFVKLAGNLDRHKISDELEFGPGWTFHFWVIRPWAFQLTLNGENGVSIFSQLLWIQSSSNLQETRTGIKNLGRVRILVIYDQSFLSYVPFSGEKNDVSSFSQSPLIGFLSNLQITRTGIKARMSSNLGRIGLLTLELFALERGFFPHRLIMGKG